MKNEKSEMRNEMAKRRRGEKGNQGGSYVTPPVRAMPTMPPASWPRPK